MLFGADLKEFKWDVHDYIRYGEENAVSQAWMKELENASARFHITRFEALKQRLFDSVPLQAAQTCPSSNRHYSPETPPFRKQGTISTSNFFTLAIWITFFFWRGLPRNIILLALLPEWVISLLPFILRLFFLPLLL